MNSQPTNIREMNPWAMICFALVGFIVGYAAHSVVAPSGAALPAAIIQQKPTAGVPSQAAPAPTQDAGNPASPEDDTQKGDKDAKVTIIEFTDYQCPFCKRYVDQTLASIQKEYIDTGKVKYYTRDYPLPFHSNAQKAAEATECAGDQDKFWEMHDVLFAKQTEWSSATDGIATFKGYADDLGLKQSTFDDCLDSGKNEAETKKDMTDGQAAGISGTPGFWIVGPDGKGQRLSGAQPFSSFKTAIDAQLAK